MNAAFLAVGRSTRACFVGAAPTPLGFIPLPQRLTPARSYHNKGTIYAYGRITMVNKRYKESQRRLDKTFKNAILRNQVAQFSMHFWFSFR